MKLTFSCFCWAHLSEALLGSILGSHLGTILRARVVIGAIVGARGAPECLKAGGSCERLFQEGPKEFRLGSTGGRVGGPAGSDKRGPTAPLPHPLPPVRRRKEARLCYISMNDLSGEHIHPLRGVGGYCKSNGRTIIPQTELAM